MTISSAIFIPLSNKLLIFPSLITILNLLRSTTTNYITIKILREKFTDKQGLKAEIN